MERRLTRGVQMHIHLLDWKKGEEIVEELASRRLTAMPKKRNGHSKGCFPPLPHTLCSFIKYITFTRSICPPFFNPFVALPPP